MLLAVAEPNLAKDCQTWVTSAVAGFVVLVLLLCASAYAQPYSNDAGIVTPLKGRTVEQMVAQYGRPIEAITLSETGGRLLIFVTPRGDRYVVETDVSGHVVSAAVKHPANR